MIKRMISLMLILALACMLCACGNTARKTRPDCAHENTMQADNDFAGNRGEFFLMLCMIEGPDAASIKRNRFSDVSEEDLYFRPANWAVKEKILEESPQGLFEPDKSVSRAEAVTWLWRAEGCPEPESMETGFTDVDEGAEYAKAVAWAARAGWIDLSPSGSRFLPDGNAGSFHLDYNACCDCGAIIPVKLTFTGEIEAGGSCGEGLTWELAGGKLTITGSGEMEDYETSYYDGNNEYHDNTEPPWYEYRAQITEVSLPEGLTYIGGMAFQDCSALSHVTIPDGVARIGDFAFASTGLKEIVIPDSVTRIGEWTFSCCNSLQSVTFPENLKQIGGMAFFGCSHLNSVALPEGLEYIGYKAFSLCKSLETVTIPESVTYIETGAFWNCPKLTEITILDRDCSIGESPTTEEETVYTLGDPKITGIAGYADSTAQAYAGEYGHRFTILKE